jgi:hypothetical protein
MHCHSISSAPAPHLRFLLSTLRTGWILKKVFKSVAGFWLQSENKDVAQETRKHSLSWFCRSMDFGDHQ